MTENLMEKSTYEYKKEALLRFLQKLSELNQRPAADLERLEFFTDHKKLLKIVSDSFEKKQRDILNKQIVETNSSKLTLSNQNVFVNLSRDFTKEKSQYEKKLRRLVSDYFYTFHLTVKRNNFFCILTDNKGNTIVPAASAGTFDFSVSKKTLKYVLLQFLRQYKKRLVDSNIQLSETIALKLTSARRYRKLLLREMNNFFFRELNADRSSVLLEIHQGKPFNGCRGVKLRKKKRFKPFVYKSIV